MASILRVLLIVDDPSDAESLVHELRQASFDPHWRRVETEAEYLVQLSERLDLILANAALPRFAAPRALRLLKERQLDLPFIVVAETGDSEAAVAFIKQGAANYLPRNRWSRLGPSVRQALDEKRQRDESRRADAALRDLADEFERERDFLNTLFHQAPFVICRLRGPRHVVAFANARLQEITGQRDIVGKPILDGLPEVAGQGYADLLDRVWATGEPYVGVERRVQLDRRGDGTLDEAYYDFLVQPTWDSAGRVDGIVAFAVEVTDHVRARQQIQDLAEAAAEERDRLQQVLAVMPAGIAILDADARIVLSNNASRAIWGLSDADVDGRCYDTIQVWHPDGIPWIPEERPLARALQYGEVTQGEQMLHYNAATNRQVPVLVNAAPLRGGARRIVGAVGVFEDITAIKDLERQKDDLLTTISHDLKNPLAGIKGQAQLLRRFLTQGKRVKSDRIVEGLTRIDVTASKMASLIDELVDTARLRMGHPLDLDRKSTDLVKLAKQVVDEHQQGTERHQLVVEATEPTLVGLWDPSRLERVLGNLLSNAIKYSPQGGTVCVEIRSENGEGGSVAVLAVRDQGMGIPAADLPHIFDSFHRARNVASRIEGTGIGLASVHEIVSQHGGTVVVESQEGRGSTFIVRLPIEEG